MWKIAVLMFFLLSGHSAIALSPNACQQLSSKKQVVCADEHFKRQDAQLNQSYQKISKQLSKYQRQQLKIAQRAWIKYRDTHCHAVDSLTPDNPNLLCLAMETQKRIDVLQQTYLSTANHLSPVNVKTLLGSWQTTSNEYGLEITFGIDKGVHYFISHLNGLPFEVGQWQLLEGELTVTGNDGKIIRIYKQVGLEKGILNLYEKDGGLEQYKRAKIVAD